MELSFREQATLKTTEDLLAIYTRPEEFQESIIRAVEDELKLRDVAFDEITHANEKRKNDSDAAIIKGKQGDPVYIFICFVFVFLGGIIGLSGGLVYTFASTRDSLGNKHYYYDEATRKKGKLMIIIGFFCFLILFSLNHNLL